MITYVCPANVPLLGQRLLAFSGKLDFYVGQPRLNPTNNPKSRFGLAERYSSPLYPGKIFAHKKDWGS